MESFESLGTFKPVRPGWLKDYVWQMSNDGEIWKDIQGADVKNNDTLGIPYLINFLKVAVDKAHKVGSEKDVIKVSLSHNKF